MTKAQALRLARSSVSAPYGRGTSWTVIGPYRAIDPSGPRTEAQRSSFAAAKDVRTLWMARIAIAALRGKYGEDEDYAIYKAEGKGSTTLPQIVTAALKLLNT